MKECAVVILNFNTKHLLQQLLPIVAEHSINSTTDLVVIDNGSTDGSIDWVKTHLPQVLTISLPTNLGFTGGYNTGLSQLSYAYYVLLNSDVETTPNWLTPMLTSMQQNPEIGVLQPKILDFYKRNTFEYAGAAGGFIDYFGYPFCRGRLFNTLETDTQQYQTTIPIFWASGAAMLVRASAWQQAQGFDANFFAHMEEIDLCWRIQQLGFSVQCNPNATVYHMGGATLKTQNPKKTFLNFRNNLYLLYKNAPKKGLKKLIFKRKILDGIAAIKFLFEGKFAHIYQIIKAHQQFSKTKYTLQCNNLGWPKNQTVLNKSIVKLHFLNKIKHFSNINF